MEKVAPRGTLTVPEKYQLARKAFIEAIPDYPEGVFSGRGIVIPGGGPRYFTCAYVAIRRLRALGCTLPIELWYLGPHELDPLMADLLKPYNVQCIDAYEVRKANPIKNLNGWELNPYSLLCSSFEEVIFLDADNIPLRDPTFLFDSDEYKETGCLFWPDYDYQRLKPNNPIWSIMEVPYRDEQTFESGQIVVNKRRCWRPMNLTIHFNSESDFYYRFILGDKDTFRFGWHCLGQKYSIIKHPVFQLPVAPLPSLCMCQHAPDGSRLFQHRNMDKFRIDMPNLYIYGLQDQDECFKHLEDLRKVWNGKVQVPVDSPEISALRKELVGTQWNWTIVGHLVRIQFQADGKIIGGNAMTGNNYRLEDTGNAITLTTLDDYRMNSRLTKVKDKEFAGTKVHAGLIVELKGL